MLQWLIFLSATYLLPFFPEQLWLSFDVCTLYVVQESVGDGFASPAKGGEAHPGWVFGSGQVLQRGCLLEPSCVCKTWCEQRVWAVGVPACAGAAGESPRALLPLFAASVRGWHRHLAGRLQMLTYGSCVLTALTLSTGATLDGFSICTQMFPGEV